MEKLFLEADAGTHRDPVVGRRAFRASIGDVFINVYALASDSVMPRLSGGLAPVQTVRRPSQIGFPRKPFPDKFLKSTYYPLQTSRNPKNS
jgi:hypothetical protein